MWEFTVTSEVDCNTITKNLSSREGTHFTTLQSRVKITSFGIISDISYSSSSHGLVELWELNALPLKTEGLGVSFLCDIIDRGKIGEEKWEWGMKEKINLILYIVCRYWNMREKSRQKLFKCHAMLASVNRKYNWINGGFILQPKSKNIAYIVKIKKT